MPEASGSGSIQADGWTVQYPDTETPSLADLSIQINAGERVLVLGPSGSGKSTLVSSLVGLVPHSTFARVSGDLQLGSDSVRVSGPGELAHRVGLVFQDPDSQLTMLTVEEEIAFGLENLGVPPEQMQARIDRALKDTGLHGWQKRSVDELSGGMKQRLVIAALLAMSPDILVLDEPTSQLDPAGSRQITQLLAELAEQRPDQTLILIEHRLDDLLPIIERVVAFNQSGQLILDADLNTAFGDHAELLAQHNVWLPTYAEAELARKQDRLGTWSAPGTDRPARVQAPALCLRGVQYGYATNQPVIHNSDLTLHAGEIMALVGGNGCGKSTLAQLCAGLRVPASGSAELYGQSVSSLPARDIAGRLGYVFQNPEHQFVTDRVIDEVRYNRSADADPDSGEWATLRALRLDHLAHRNPFTLSHGQKRRLSAATVLVSRRELLILDEPTFGQDPSALAELRALLAALADAGTAILLITHDMNLVWRSAHRVVALQSGRLSGAESPIDFFADTGRLSRLGLSEPSLAGWFYRSNTPERVGT